MAMKRRHTSYLISIGNSDTGPIGACLRVCANTKDDAIAYVRKTLTTEYDLPCDIDNDRIGYCEVYFNTDAIEKDAIIADESEPCSKAHPTNL